MKFVRCCQTSGIVYPAVCGVLLIACFMRLDLQMTRTDKRVQSDVKEACAFKDLIDKPDCGMKIKSRDTQDMIAEGTGTPSPPNPPVSAHPLPRGR
ncbi:hypothetical protein ROHU_034390 [Labeo rohita]|uniref:Uncharacterized protein n=1 Tax=Labeo rohita TaxID=84645 RepID=A0A498LE12_LABRO|nr:hypothetical protein ROHU_034390 [Labeo rohita]